MLGKKKWRTHEKASALSIARQNSQQLLELLLRQPRICDDF
jgi:hypothetical protein